MRKRQERESGIKSRGFCHHAKELGHYSVYDRKALKSETALIKSVCVCVYVSENFQTLGVVVFQGLLYNCRQGGQLRGNR